MTPSYPPSPADRDPKLVLIGLPVTGDPLFELMKTLASLELQEAGGRRFKVVKVGEQGLPKARNIITHVALLHGAADLVMVDGDIKATPQHILQLLSHDQDVVCALYPKRQFPLQWVGEFEKADPATSPPGLWPTRSAGTGLIRIRLSAVDRILDRLAKGKWFDRRPLVQWFESDDDIPHLGIRRGARMHDFWGQGVVADDWWGRKFPRYLTEDYFFSYLCRQAKIPVWTDTRCQVGHVGRVDFLDLANQVDKLVGDRVKAALHQAGVKAEVEVGDRAKPEPVSA